MRRATGLHQDEARRQLTTKPRKADAAETLTSLNPELRIAHGELEVGRGQIDTDDERGHGRGSFR